MTNLSIFKEFFISIEIKRLMTSSTSLIKIKKNNDEHFSIKTFVLLLVYSNEGKSFLTFLLHIYLEIKAFLFIFKINLLEGIFKHLFYRVFYEKTCRKKEINIINENDQWPSMTNPMLKCNQNSLDNVLVSSNSLTYNMLIDRSSVNSRLFFFVRSSKDNQRLWWTWSTTDFWNTNYLELLFYCHWCYNRCLIGRINR